jgi:thiosulfate dehydrogenase (quinone) large subunit
MNFSYVLACTVSSNPLDILLGLIILTAGFNTGHIGLERWVTPFMVKFTAKNNNKGHMKQSA